MKIVFGNKSTGPMKKVFYALCTVSAIASLTLSCVKESSPIEEKADNKTIVADGIPTEILCVINPDDAQTKTQYDGNVTFGWTNGDQIRFTLLKWSGPNATGEITACDMYTFTTSVASGSAAASFTRYGASDDLEDYDPNPTGAANTWTSMGYLIYPCSIFNKERSGTKPVVNLPASIAYNESSPLNGGVVPLVGRKDGETYKFSTAVGIIKLTVSNAPSAGNKIKLVSTDKPIAGKFAISDVDATVSQIANTSATAGTNELTLTGLSLSAGETYEFYLPVPVGTYSANSLSISVLDSNDLPLLEKTIAKEITIARNEVLSIPTLLYHRAYVVDTNPYHPSLYTEKPTGASTILIHVSNTKLTAANYSSQWSNSKNTNRFGSDTNGYHLTKLSDVNSDSFFSTSGTYYLQYIILSEGNTKPAALNSSNVLIYGSYPFTYTAPGSDKLSLSASMLDVPYRSTAEGQKASYLVDGDTGTYWHSPYGSEDPARNATYGQIISIDLNEASLTTDGNFSFCFCTRGVNNNHAKVINFYVSNERWDEPGFEENKVKVGSTDNALVGINPAHGQWVAPINCTGTGSYRYITISILEDSNGNDLRSSSCTHMAEIEFYTK